MAQWPTDPSWNLPSQINNGNEYTPQDGLLFSDINKIIQNILYLYSYGSTDSEVTTQIQKLSKKVEKLEDQMQQLIYVPIQITSFNVSPSVAEIGSIVTNPILSWTLNKEAHAVMINNTEISVNNTSYEVDGTYDSNTSWTLTAEDAEQSVVTRTATLSFLNGVYYGVSQAGEIDSYMIQQLTKELRSSHKSSFTVNAGMTEYIYYCIPVRFGTCKFKIGGFNGGFRSPQVIEFTNPSGYTENYYVYMSSNPNLGETKVEVENG